jgi:lipooligosaccharide transport system permease protein
MNVRPVYEYFLTAYRRSWQASIFGQFIVPLLFVVSIGFGVGSFVNAGGVLGVDYLTYLIPGLLASTGFQLAVGESTFPVYSNFVWSRYYFAIQATPVRTWEMIVGQLAFLITRVLVAGSAFLLVMFSVGAIHSPWLLGALPVVMLLGLATGAPTMAFSAWSRSEHNFTPLHRFGLIPLTLFSGVFFPVSQLPDWLRLVAYASPLWHAVELCRGFSLAYFPPAATLGHTVYLLLWATLGLILARAMFIRRLAK